MSYRTVFDITNPFCQDWSFLLFGFLFIAIGVVVVCKPHLLHNRAQWSTSPIRAFGFLMIGFSVFWTATSFYFTHAEYLRLRRLFEAGRFEVVEGIVSEFAPETSVTKIERFCVKGKCFKYSQNLGTGGFNNSNLFGGPIRSGLPVRVSYLGNKILKLEVGTAALPRGHAK